MSIQVVGLEKAYAKQVLFENVSFSMMPQERLGVVGRNGHGKSTLFRILLGQEEADGGDIFIPKDYRIAHLSQHLHFTAPTSLDEACTVLPMLEGGWQETYKAEEVLAGLGFSPEDVSRPPGNLSGGYQVRLNLAKALLSEPNLLLLDEPTNYLDIVSLRWLERFLKLWPNELMLITHDRTFMDSVATHTMAIHRAKARKVEGGTEKLYQVLAQEEELYEQTRQNQEKRFQQAERFINRFRAQASRAKAVQSRIKQLEKIDRLEELDAISELDFQFNTCPFPGKWVYEVNDLAFRYTEDGPNLLEGVSFAFGKNDRIGVIGKNGKGKTTFLNILAGELEPTDGRILRNPNTRLGYFGQTNVNRLTLSHTVEEEIMSAHPERLRSVARSIAGLMMFQGDDALKKISVLSGGERSRVLLGKLLVHPANCLFLDEPTHHLDMYSVDTLVEALQDFPGAVLLVTHNEMLLRALATRLIIFDGGSVSVFEGDYDDFLDRVGWAEEEDQRPKKKAKPSKEKRKERADKNASTAPVRKRIAELEEKIVSLEASVKKHESELVLASAKGSAALITELSKKLAADKAQIDSLFTELEQASAELEDE